MTQSHASVVGSNFRPLFHSSLCLSQNSNGWGQARLPRWRPRRGGLRAGREVGLRPWLGPGWESVRPGALKKEDPYGSGGSPPPSRMARESCNPPITDPCNPSGYSALPFEPQGGGPGNPRALSHSGSQASKKPHQPQRDTKLTGWCVSTSVLVVQPLSGRSAERRSLPWPLAYPHPILEGSATALLHEWWGPEGGHWGWSIAAEIAPGTASFPGSWAFARAMRDGPRVVFGAGWVLPSFRARVAPERNMACDSQLLAF